jgi:hypothetical protein
MLQVFHGFLQILLCSYRRKLVPLHAMKTWVCRSPNERAGHVTVVSLDISHSPWFESRLEEIFCSLKTVHTGSGAHRAFSSMVTGVLLRGKSSRGVALATSLRLELKLRVSGVMPRFPYTPS